MPSGAARFAARVKAERRRRRRRTARIAAAVLGPPVLVALAGFSPLCDVDEVRVTGVRRLAATEVRRVAAVPRAHPLATLDVGEIERRVAALPGVRSARVRRVWPSTVEIRVVERKPVLAVPLGRHGVALHDADGVLVAHAGRVPPGVPLLHLAPGARPDRDLVTAALVLVRTLPPQLRDQVVSLHAGSAADLSFRLRDGAEVMWGDAAHPAEKLRALRLLLPQRARRYDVRVPDLPTVSGAPR